MRRALRSLRSVPGPRRLPLRLLCLLWIAALCPQWMEAVAARQSPVVEKAFAEFWKADEAKNAEKAAESLVKSGVDFDTAWARLKAGRPYGKERTGDLSIRATAGAGVLIENAIEIPADYTPDRPWALRVQLHGGVNRQSQQIAGGSLEEDNQETGGGGGRAPSLGRRRPANRIPGENQIYVFPSGSAEAAWWHASQVDNILRVVDRLKRRYNVDESRIYLTGISDGGTGVYYMALKSPTVWSSFLPLNGSIKVLGNSSLHVDGELFTANMANRPFFIVNGGRDPLYPVEHVATHVEAFKRLGVVLDFRPQPTAGHDTSWWPYERGPFEQFVKLKARQAHPARVSWETERTDRYNRADWLIIERLGPGAADSTFENLDIFDHRRPSGRVDIERTGNAFEAQSRGVREFTLLLSPDAIDFDQPITVTVNGKQAYQGPVKKDAAALLKWAARDADRQRLYGAELRVQVP